MNSFRVYFCIKIAFLHFIAGQTSEIGKLLLPLWIVIEHWFVKRSEYHFINLPKVSHGLDKNVLPDAGHESEDYEVDFARGQGWDDAADGVNQQRSLQNLLPTVQVGKAAPEVASNQHSWIKWEGLVWKTNYFDLPKIWWVLLSSKSFKLLNGLDYSSILVYSSS